MTPTDPEALERRRIARNARLRVMRRERASLPPDAVMARGSRPAEGPEDWPELHAEPYERDPIARAVLHVCGDDSMTLEDVGVLMHLTRARVQAIEAHAVAKVGAEMRRLGFDADEVGAWLSRRSKGEQLLPDDRRHRVTSRTERYEQREAERDWEAEADAMVRDIRETAAANRMVERVVCGMEVVPWTM